MRKQILTENKCASYLVEYKPKHVRILLACERLNQAPADAEADTQSLLMTENQRFGHTCCVRTTHT